MSTTAGLGSTSLYDCGQQRKGEVMSTVAIVVDMDGDVAKPL
jgi:hypothetical protein